MSVALKFAHLLVRGCGTANNGPIISDKEIANSVVLAKVARPTWMRYEPHTYESMI